METKKAFKKPLKILLVDDEVGYTNVLANRLQKRNLIVIKAYSGQEALVAMRSQDFDVAIFDLKMEDMDGIELLKISRKLLPDMPVIILTGHGSEQAAREGIEMGAFDYLTKPCELDELLGKIYLAHKFKEQNLQGTNIIHDSS